MASVIYIDSEIDVRSKRVLDIGGITNDGVPFHSDSFGAFTEFITGTTYLCGHNIICHDIPHLTKFSEYDFTRFGLIDTLFLSPLLFPKEPYHRLVKDDKLQTEELNNPLNDAIKAKELFEDEVTTFRNLDNVLKEIFHALLGNQSEFAAFFKYVHLAPVEIDLVHSIMGRFSSQLCSHSPIQKLTKESPVELAYCLALINTNSRYSITPPWVVKTFPDVERVMYLLRNRPCITGCAHCNKSLDARIGLKKYFGYDSYRTFDGQALQLQAVEAAIRYKSLLAVFPTGGGKSLTFQVPALMSGENVKGLTVVISPLQSLMKDQVDNLEKANITEAVTINGLLDPIERMKSIERVANGAASLLYISPESLRSKTIERLLLGRNVVRFVIDEAHCLSAWGQDFRVDYLYIADFIKSFTKKKNINGQIPVSCFTATAKPAVIQDISDYFYDHLDVRLEIFKATSSRPNLQFKVIPKDDEQEKYRTLRNLIDSKNCPTIIYVSRTKKADDLAKQLSDDGHLSLPYHGRMDVREKTDNQDAFMSGEVQNIVATSAFGMGVDKKDVGLVIHYDISNSLENYVQEAGRAGRDQKIMADCYVLFAEDDLNQHFSLLNQSKLNIKEIQQVWRAIKHLTKFRSQMSQSALEIARTAGWEHHIYDIETRIKTAINALEQAGYLKRRNNMPRVFADSIISRNAQEAIQRINNSPIFSDRQKQQGTRIIKKLFSSKTRKQAIDDDAESRVDYISDHLGIKKEEVIGIIHLLREEHILADAKDLTAYIKGGPQKNKSLKIHKEFSALEIFLTSHFSEKENNFNLKELNELALDNDCPFSSIRKLKKIINLWSIQKWIKRKRHSYLPNQVTILSNYSKEKIIERLEKRHKLVRIIIDYLFKKSKAEEIHSTESNGEHFVEFSIKELKDVYIEQMQLFGQEIQYSEIEDALFYLSRIDAINIEGGFLVTYNALSIERLEKNNQIQYKSEDYKTLQKFYENKIQQIHIVGEYALKMIHENQEALQFVEDYFQLNYYSFLNKYFDKNRQTELKRNLSPKKFEQLFGALSTSQLQIIKDNKSQFIAVTAGPGSGKTKVLVHKLASLILMEDVKAENLLMLTFSRAAATEFRKRLIHLIGTAALYVQIKTFHSFCFDILGKVGTLDKSDSIIKESIEKIRSRDIEISKITKTVLVIDEAQDMSRYEYELIQVLMKENDHMRVIAVGDDDQNIYEFRGSSSKYLEQFIKEQKATTYQLVKNYRSKQNLVQFTNQLSEKITHRLKSTPIVAVQKDSGILHIRQYANQNLVKPLVKAILNSELSGSTCVLTFENEDAVQIAGMLNAHGITAKLIQSNDSFNLYDLQEVRYFIEQLYFKEDTHTISADTWQYAKKKLWTNYRDSPKIDICVNLIKEFELSNPKKKFQSDFKVFVKESKIEDFATVSGETIFISTMHKSKGKEFDNVFIMLPNYQLNSDEKKRLLYVVMTRAKKFLAIHLKGNYLNNLYAEKLNYTYDDSKGCPTRQMILQLTHRDVWLSFFHKRQRQISKLKSGDSLAIDNEGCKVTNRAYVLRFSKKFKERICEYESRGYKLTEAIVNYLIFWRQEDSEKEILILLPQVTMVKSDVSNS